MTFAGSLWISRPDLRGVPLEIRCLDRTAAVLEAGKKFFSALTSGSHSGSAGTACPWIVKTIRCELRRNGNLSAEIRGKKAALTTAVNVYNELFWDFSPTDTDDLERFTEKQARLLSSLTESSGSILVVEPGIPRSGELISRLRSALLNAGRAALFPCTHRLACPMPGGLGTSGKKERWCHFAFDTEDAPEELHKLSSSSQLPKERAVLSFLLAGPASQKQPQNLAGEKSRKAAGEKPIKARSLPGSARIISDSFPLGKEPDGKETWGRYGCCEHGLVLVTGSRRSLEHCTSGALEELELSGRKDAKSGAYLAAKRIT
jgi:hypothetical protein